MAAHDVARDRAVTLVAAVTWAVIGLSLVIVVGAVVAFLAGRERAARVSTVRAGGIETALARLERAAEDADAGRDEARVERDRLAAALAGSPDGVIVVDAAGSVVLRSDAALRFVDPRHSDAIAADVVSELLDRARTGTAGRRELQLFGPPRRIIVVDAMPIVREGGALGGAAYIRDVTETRRVENIRRDFVANVSHELKTPIGALALLAETIATGDDPNVARQLADRMVREADRLGQIIDDLLDLSLIEAQETPTRDPVPVHILLTDAVDHVHEAADLAGIPVVIAPVPADLAVRCDQRQVVSALTNLLDNAVKYSDAGEAVEVDARIVGDRVAISVRDHGIGIPARDRERIFERFYRVDRARSRATGGTGLGLSIVRHVAQAHGGDVGVESREGEGSTFTLHLPLNLPTRGDVKVS